MASLACPSLLERLRRDTRESHEKLESHCCFQRLMQGRMSQRNYIDFLLLYAGHTLPLADSLHASLGQTSFQPFIDFAFRLPALKKDLAHFGQSWPPARQHSVAWCKDESTAFQVGVLYVHVGSRLGARVISRQLQARYAMGASNGGRFFAIPEGPPVWPGFLRLLESDALKHHLPAVVLGARAGFDTFHQWLSQLQHRRVEYPARQ